MYVSGLKYEICMLYCTSALSRQQLSTGANEKESSLFTFLNPLMSSGEKQLFDASMYACMYVCINKELG